MRKFIAVFVLLFASSCFGQEISSGWIMSGRTFGGTTASPSSGYNVLGIPQGFTGWLGMTATTQLTASPADTLANNVSGAYTNSTNQCLPNGFNNACGGTGNCSSVLGSSTRGYYTYNSCAPAMNAQSSGFLNTYLNVYCVTGGGHADYFGNDIWCIDLKQAATSMMRAKDASWPPNTQNGAGGGATTATNLFTGSNCDTTNCVQSPWGLLGTNLTPQIAGGTWHECVPVASSGLGCSPNSSHTTGEIKYIAGRSWNGTSWQMDHTKDIAFLGPTYVTDGNGSPGSSATWTLPLTSTGLGITNASQWIRMDSLDGSGSIPVMTKGPGANGIPTVFSGGALVDPDNGLVYVSDPNSSATSLALWAYDRFGSISPSVQGTANKWYRLTSVNGFKHSTDIALAYWKNPIDSHKWLVNAGGCKSDNVTTATNDGAGNLSITITQTLGNGQSQWLNGMFVYLYKTGSANLDGGPYTITSPTSNTATQTFTATGGVAGAASVATGLMVSCDRGLNNVTSLTHGVNGVNAADVTDTTQYATSGITQVDWTANTLAASNVDLGGVGYNTCAEMLSGGLAPLRSSTSNYGGISIGLTYDPVTGNLLAWPNAGGYVYQVTPVITSPTSNSYLTCKRIDYSANPDAPPNSAVNGSNSTWGVYGEGKFAYVPDADAWVLCHMPTAACRALRLRPNAPANANNTITIFETSGSTQTSRTVSIPRPFVQGEYPSGSYPQAVVAGSAVTTQVDVKNAWADGSLKFAIVSFVVPSIPANGWAKVYFTTQASTNNGGALNQAGMLAGGYNFDSVTSLVNSGAGVTRTVSARSMLSAGNWRYWLQGPIVTAVILEDRSTTRTWDTNTDGQTIGANGSLAPLHPMFEAYFYPTNNHVDVNPIFENTWASSTAGLSANDQPITSVSITQGNSSPTSCFSLTSSWTFIAFSRWQRHCTTGTALGSIGIDYNGKYLISTKALPNWDTSTPLTTASITANSLTAWNAIVSAGIIRTSLEQLPPRDVGVAPCIGMYEKGINGTGAHQYVGLIPAWDVTYLLGMQNQTYRDQLRAVTIGNADIAGRMPIHYREADAGAGTGQRFDAPLVPASAKPPYSGAPGTVGTFGRVISLNARQQISLTTGTNYNSGSGCTGATADYLGVNTHTTDSITGIDGDSSHAPDMYYFPYLMTGSYYYLEGLQMEAAFYATQRNPCYNASTVYNASYRMGRWSLGYSSTSVRAQAWAFRTLAYAGFISPDADPEHAYFVTAVKQQIQEYEGGHLLNAGTNGSYGADSDLSAIWTYGKRDQGAGSWWGSGSFNNLGVDTANQGPSPIGEWRSQGPGHVSSNLLTDGSVDSGEAAWEESFMSASLGAARDMGYSTDSLLKFTAKRFFRIALDSTFNAPYAIQNYFEPTHMTATATSWISSGTVFQTAFASGYNQTCWQTTTSGVACNTTGINMQDSHAYQTRSVLSFMTGYTVDGYSGLNAWNTIDAVIPEKRWLYDSSGGNGSPAWSLVPRN
jgi:hypothetical protein